MKRFIDMEQSPLSVFPFINLVRVQVIRQMNTPFNHFCIIIKDFSISFSRVIIVQDFETVAFYALFVYKPTFSVIFCRIRALQNTGGALSCIAR